MRQSASEQFSQGFTAPVRAFRLLRRTDGLWKLAVAPMLLSMVLLVGAITTALFTAGPLADHLFGDLHRWLYTVGFVAVLFLLSSALGSLAYMAAALLAIPFHDALSEGVEVAMGETPPELSVREALPRSVIHSIASFGVWLLAELVVAPLQMVPGIGSLLGTVLGFLLTAFFLAHQLLDGPMSRRALSFGDKMSWLRDRLPWVLGIGSGGTLLLLVPLMNLAALPLLVAGGAVLWVEISREERASAAGELLETDQS